MKQTYQTGLEGEHQAEKYLCEEMKMVCLERRYRSRHAEIDLIMLDGNTVVFVEVKTRRKDDPGNGLRAVTPGKQRKIAQAATVYLLSRHMMNYSIRFDVIEINAQSVIYVPNAFQPGGVFFAEKEDYLDYGSFYQSETDACLDGSAADLPDYDYSGHCRGDKSESDFQR